MNAPQNLFDPLPAALPAELFETLAEKEGLKIERILSRGQSTPEEQWLNQETHEWVVLLKGRARLAFEGRPEVQELGPGDYIHIAPGVRHRVEWTSPNETSVWLAVHYQ